MSYRGDYYPPAKPIRVKNGIAVRSKKGAIGGTWWSKRFIEALERIGIGSRLQRGKSYARNGQVVTINIEGGFVHAQVQGTNPRPYSVTIAFSRFPDTQWEEILDALSSQALFAAGLLGGEMPQEIEKVFAENRLSLLPAGRKEIITNCSCPDSANPCKHIAAVYYILAEQFDRDPFLIFALRGRDRETILDGLRKRRGAVAEPGAETVRRPDPPPDVPSGTNLPPLSECMDTFWEAGELLETFPIYLHAKPELEAAAIKRLGPSLYRVKGKDLADLLIPVYPKARNRVLKEIERSSAGRHETGER
ncbi:MAG: SWIM zinc finger family protein [Methanoregula sp.]|jgi:uncharacterized Zn finger protein|nr:SWIM zinc finger family protein [Methanoregula sp.]